MHYTCKVLEILTVRTFYFEFSNRSLFERFFSFCLHYRILNSRVSISLVIISLLFRVIFILLRINSKTLSYKFNINTINMLYQSCNRWKNLLCDIPININCDFTLRSNNFIRMICFISKLRILLVSIKWLFTNNIGNEIVDQVSFTLLSYFLHSFSYSYMRLSLCI